MTMTRKDALLRESMEMDHMSAPMTESRFRVAFELDEGQQYDVGARVTVHAMNGAFRTVAMNPSSGNYRVMRCERVGDIGWRALRISLHHIALSGSDGSLPMLVTDARP
jgi:hypothetical protein